MDWRVIHRICRVQKLSKIMIYHGVLPVVKDHRDRSYPRTFGSVRSFPTNFCTDAGLTMPDQNADGYPNGCTGYTQSELCTDEDKKVYDPAYTYEKALFIMGGKNGDPVDMRSSLKSTIIYGVKLKGDDTDNPYTHRRGAYYNVTDETELDTFDDIRSALLTNNYSVSIATPWYLEWDEQAKNNGIVSMGSQITSWHNWKVCGWKTLENGVPYLIGKTWQGDKVGDKGWMYFPREVINAVMQIRGTGAFTLAPASPSNLQNIKTTFLEWILSYLRNVVGLPV